MKQKIVVKVTLNGQKSRSKALKVSVGLSGVESAALGGQDKSQIEVVGDGVDAVELTTLLRKNVGYAEIISVSAVGEKKDEKKDDKKEEPKVVSYPYTYAMMPHYIYEVPSNYQYQYQEDPSCSIM